MIIIPMAGLSSRFFKAGFSKPKYMLPAHGITLFEHSVLSFSKYFKSKKFIFIVRDVFDTPAFVQEKVRQLGIEDYDISILSNETRGQAETVFIGMQNFSGYSGPITIFNIDTFRPNYLYPNFDETSHGFLDVFEGDGTNWSFVLPKNTTSTHVIKTTEKDPISNLCCTGLYHFDNYQDYINAYNEFLKKPVSEWTNGELYIAPLYNHLIAIGHEINYSLIDKNDVIFCGTPDEYYTYLKS
ncbi:glycosyltransferase family 2 protein [Aeromonas bivalvium]|uniref:glycosyltransferase family 2 protein n=1 Tax=Aeromonas bivalvium TaxID=440079 RepID=UPI0038D180C5